MRRETLSATLHPDLSIRILLGVLEEQEIDPQAVLRATGVTSGDQVDLPAKVSGQQELAAQRAFVQASGYRPDLWLAAGLRYRFAAFGDLGLLFMTSRDLVQVVETRLRVHFTYTASYTHPIYVDGELIGQVLDVSEVADDMVDFSACHVFGTVSALHSDMLGMPFPFTHIDFAFPDPGAAFGALLPAPARFNAERTAWYWHAALSRQRLPYHDSGLNRLLTEGLQRELSSNYHQSDGFLGNVSQAISGANSSSVTVGQVADTLGLTPRTLQRRLAENGIGFRELVTSIRRDEAIELLLSTELTIADIAFRVGYSDATGFEHAFRRWTGESPTRYRHKSAQVPGGTN